MGKYASKEAFEFQVPEGYLIVAVNKGIRPFIVVGKKGEFMQLPTVVPHLYEDYEEGAVSRVIVSPVDIGNYTQSGCIANAEGRLWATNSSNLPWMCKMDYRGALSHDSYSWTPAKRVDLQPEITAFESLVAAVLPQTRE